MLMHKLILLLKQTEEQDIINNFETKITGFLSELAGQKINAGKIEFDLLSESRFIRVCEIETENQEEMQNLMSTKTGKLLNKELSGYSNLIVPLFVNF